MIQSNDGERGGEVEEREREGGRERELKYTWGVIQIEDIRDNNSGFLQNDNALNISYADELNHSELLASISNTFLT